MGSRGLAPTTIKGYLSALRSLHVDEGLPFEFMESPVLQRVIRGIKRFHGGATNQKLPISLGLLRRILGLDPDSTDTDDRVFKAACAVAWPGGLRCGEFTLKKNEKFSSVVHLTRGCFRIQPDLLAPTHAALTVPASKTDPFRKGVTLMLALADDPLTCPVRHVLLMLLVQPDPDLASPLFQRSDGSAITRDWFISQLRTRLTRLGVDASRYAGHSFRRGMATSAATAGYSDYEIQLLGRWRSDAYKLYLDVPRERILALSAALHVVDAAARA